MQGLMMDGSLTLAAVLDRAERVFGCRRVVSRGSDRAVTTTTYAEVAPRARRVAAALDRLGLPPGSRVATLLWNTREHLELYFGVPAAGHVIHTLNPRLSLAELGHIVNHAEDAAIVADASLREQLDTILSARAMRHVVVVGGDGEGLPDGWTRYEDLVASVDDPGELPTPHERTAAAMCYTSGTTGNPKGVLYSHRSLVLHSWALSMADAFGLCEADVMLPVVPMFHVNAWGFPIGCGMVGAELVLPGPFLDPASLLELLTGERVTITAGVPTVWMALLDALDAAPGAHDLSALRCMAVGGSAAPPAMIDGFQRRHGLTIVHAWGMTETSPVATVSRVPPHLAGAADEERLRVRCRQGRPLPFVELRARGDDGLVPWDGHAMGELEVRGPWVASAYVGGDGAEKFTADGWFQTGDIVTIDETGSIEITDRSKDVVKSGGEWISSVALENALMAHPAVAEAAVIAVHDAKWGERPLAVVVARAGESPSPDELRAHLAGGFPKWWLPDRVEFVDAIPRTATGKWKKSVLREMFPA